MIKIYTWEEVWIVVSVPAAITGVWFLFSFMLSIRNDVGRTVAIWSLLFILTAGAAVTDYLRKQQK